MFPSLVQTQALVLIAICSLVVARDELDLDDFPINKAIPAAPGESIQDVALEPLGRNATDGVVVGHLFPACNGKRVGGHKALHVPTDRCLTTPGFGIEIQVAAVCADGNRAQWARFSDEKCGNGKLSPTYGLVDLADSDIGQCLSTGVIGAEEKISSMAFWCDGVKTSSPEDDGEEGKPDEGEGKPGEEEVSKPGSVSESACMPGKAPFFSQPEIDTCVNLRGSKLKIYSTGSCANGTQPTLALYGERACVGGPAEFREIGEADIKVCIDLNGASSYAFYCTGAGLGAPEADLPSNPGEGKQSGSIMQFLLVLFLILLLFILMLVLSVYAWVRKYGDGAGKLIDLVKGLWKPREGAIAL